MQRVNGQQQFYIVQKTLRGFGSFQELRIIMKVLTLLSGFFQWLSSLFRLLWVDRRKKAQSTHGPECFSPVTVVGHSQECGTLFTDEAPLLFHTECAESAYKEDPEYAERQNWLDTNLHSEWAGVVFLERSFLTRERTVERGCRRDLVEFFIEFVTIGIGYINSGS